MTNLYDFLRRVLAKAESPDLEIGEDRGSCGPSISNKYLLLKDDEIEWLRHFLESPGHEIHFKAHQVGEKNGEPVFSKHFAIAGAGPDVFALLTEAMLNNATFASQVVLATRFWFEHLPFCESCKKRYFAATSGQVSWIFSPHKPL